VSYITVRGGYGEACHATSSAPLGHRITEPVDTVPQQILAAL
jgi:hypothetical protein